MEIFPFTPQIETWMAIGITVGAVVGAILFLGGIGGYVMYALRPKTPRDQGERQQRS